MQTLLAREFGKRTLDADITNKMEIMVTVEKQVIEEYAKLGITIDYVGYASQLNFSDKIQEAIDMVYVAKKLAIAAEDQMKAMEARSMMANIQIKEGIAEAAKKWDGKLNMPGFMVLPPEVIGLFKGVFGDNFPTTRSK